MRPYLVMQWGSPNNSQCAVYSNQNGNLTKIGNDFGTKYGVTSTSTNNVTPINNRAIHWNGSIWCVDGNNEVWKYDIANSGVWGKAYDIVNANATDRYWRTGFYPLLKNGEPIIAAFFNSTTVDAARAVIVDISGNFRETAYTSVGGSQIQNADRPGFTSDLIVNNRVYGFVNGSFIISFDPENETFTSISLPGADAQYGTPGMCVHQGEVYLAYADASSSPADRVMLSRLEGSIINELGLITDIQGNSNYWHNWALFSDDEFIYLLKRQEAGAYDGFTCTKVKVDPTGLSTWDITSTVPTPFRAGTVNTSNIADRVGYYIDQETIINGKPQIIIQYTPDTDSDPIKSTNLYEFSATGVWSFLGAGSDNVGTSHSYGGDGGGHRSFSASGEYDVILGLNKINRTTIDVDMWIKGAPTGVQGVVVDVKFSTDGKLPHTACFIDSILEGPGYASGNYHIAGLPTDGTKTTFRWRANQQGVVPGDFPKLVARAADWS